ncbi:MAG: hypothetical protein ABEI52_12290, partial [Halobacteriaceae archaeon]
MNDLRAFLSSIEERGQLQHVSGADQYLEIGSLSQIVRRDELGHALLFEEIPETISGSRIVTNALDTPLQVTLALGHEPTTSVREAVVQQKERANDMETRPVKMVSTGPVFDNI